MVKKRKNSFKLLIYFLFIFAVFLLIIILIKSRTARASIYVTIFIVINMIIASYKRFLRIPIEFEVLTLGIVICTFQFGIKVGLVLAIIGGILSFIVGYNISPFSFPMLLGYMLIAVVTYLFKGFDLVFLGILSTLINNLMLFLVYSFVFDYDIFKNLSFGISNILFNTIFFLNLAPFLLRIIV